MAVAGLVLMLFLPLALILNLGIASGPVAFGLAPAAWVALAGFVLLLAVMGMEKMGREDHARDRMFAILFLIALNPLFWGLLARKSVVSGKCVSVRVDLGGSRFYK